MYTAQFFVPIQNLSYFLFLQSLDMIRKIKEMLKLNAVYRPGEISLLPYCLAPKLHQKPEPVSSTYMQ